MDTDGRVETRGLNGRNIIEVIRNMRSELRKSDRKVADVVLDDPHRIMNATVSETATLAEVSQPTVLRFATAIGCSGFQDLKIRLAQSLALGTPATHSVLVETDEPEVVAEKIFDYTMTSLDWARSRLDKDALHKAIDILTQCNSIVFSVSAHPELSLVMLSRNSRCSAYLVAQNWTRTSNSWSLP